MGRLQYAKISFHIRIKISKNEGITNNNVELLQYRRKILYL